MNRFIIILLISFINFTISNVFFASTTLNNKSVSHIQKKTSRIYFARRSQWIGSAETYGAPTINLIVNFINDCHYRMRFYYYMGASQPNVIFGKFRYNNSIVILKDGAGNKVRMFLSGSEMRGADNNYRIVLRRIR
jgi:hypothetical protein